MESFRLIIENLSKAYRDLDVFQGLDCTMESGHTYCLMGPSGCGKTTLFRIILGLEAANGGSILLSPKPALPLVAVFQENRLCEDFSPLDNVMLAVRGAMSRELAYKELCRLLPEESVLRPAGTLSGGMKRRVAILRALLAPSCGILMDEPFTGLDDDTKDVVISYIKEKAADKLLLVATHQEEDIAALGGELLRLF